MTVDAGPGGPAGPGPSPRPGRAREWGALAVLLVLGALLRFHGLARESLWLDEGYTLAMVRQTFSENLRESLKDVHSVTYFEIVRPFVRFLGEGEAGLRTPSAIAGSILPLAAFLLAREIGIPAAALPAALVTALSSYQVRYSQEARLYSLLVLFSTLGMIAFVRLLRPVPAGRSPRPWRAILAYAAAMLLCLALHHYAIFLLAAQVAVVCLSRAPGLREGRRRFRIALAALAPFLAAWTLLSVSQWKGIGGFSSVERASLGAVSKTVKLLLVPDFEKSRNETWVLTLLLAIAAFPRARRLLSKRDPGPAKERREESALCPAPPAHPSAGPALVLGAWFSFTLLVPVAVSWFGFPIFRKRYAISAGIPLYLALGWALAGYRPLARKRVLAAVGALLAGSHLVAWEEGPRKEDWRSAAAFVSERADLCRRIVVDDYGYRFAFGSYLSPGLRERIERIQGESPETGTACAVLGPIHPGAKNGSFTAEAEAGASAELTRFRGPIDVFLPRVRALDVHSVGLPEVTGSSGFPTR